MAHYLFNFTKKGARKDQSLREQAVELLRAGLWGIGEKTPNKGHLAQGDRILAYVGAPERQFIGAATLTSSFHNWTSEEADRYPGDFHAGVRMTDAIVFEPAVPIDPVWPQMPSSENNPNARFFSGVVQIRAEDLKLVIVESTGPTQTEPSTHNESVAASSSNATVKALFSAVEKLRVFIASPHDPLSEDGTRAFFIDPYLKALGYKGFGDVDHGVQVESKDFADYVLRVDNEPAIVVEAKKLGTSLGADHAAQVVKYSSVLGIRWGVVTDGKILRVYDGRIPGVPPKDRLVFEIDLAGYSDFEDFQVAIYPDLALLGKDAMGSGLGLEQRAAQEAARELLTGESTATLSALQSELKDKKAMHLSDEEVAELVGKLVG